MPPTPAPWKPSFISQVTNLACPTFSFATISNPSTTSLASAATPHVRTLIYRGFYASLPPNPHNPITPNIGFTSDLLTYTTDKRMEKFRDLGSTEGISPLSTSEQKINNNIEACFWIPSQSNPAIGTQWRIRGRSIILPRYWEKQDDTKKWLMERVSKDGSKAGDEEFDFEKENAAQFGNLSPALRGSFKNPPPTSPKELGKQSDKWDLKQRVQNDQLEDEVALDNFRVCVIEPIRVEFLDLENSKKKLWVLAGSDAEKSEQLDKYGEVNGSWREVEVWP